MIHELRKNNNMLEVALKKREEWLKNHPNMKDLQEEIDIELKKAGKSTKNRIAALHRLMTMEVMKMNKTFKEIQEDTQKVQEIIKTIQS